MPIQWQAQDFVEPVSDTNIESAHNQSLYAVIIGCELTYNSGTMQVSVAEGIVLFNGELLNVAEQLNAVTLVADTGFSRWTWAGISNAGVLEIVSGDPATATVPATVPELGDRVGAGLLRIQANQTIAANCSPILDKRVPYPLGGWVAKVKPADQTVSASTTLVDDDALFFPVAADHTYEFEWRVYLTTTTNADFKVSATYPVEDYFVVVAGTGVNSTVGDVAQLPASGGTWSVITANASGDGIFIIRGMIKPTAAGTVQFQWAQGVASGDTVVLAGSTQRVAVVL